MLQNQLPAVQFRRIRAEKGDSSLTDQGLFEDMARRVHYELRTYIASISPNLSKLLVTSNRSYFSRSVFVTSAHAEKETLGASGDRYEVLK